MAKNSLLLLLLWVVLIAFACSAFSSVLGARHRFHMTAAGAISTRENHEGIQVPGVTKRGVLTGTTFAPDPDYNDIDTEELDEISDPCRNKPPCKKNKDCNDKRCVCSKEHFQGDEATLGEEGICLLYTASETTTSAGETTENEDETTDGDYETSTSVTDTSAASSGEETDTTITGAVGDNQGETSSEEE